MCSTSQMVVMEHKPLHKSNSSTFRFIVGFKQQHQSLTHKSWQHQFFVNDLLIDLWQCRMVNKNETSNLRQCRSFVNKMIIVLFQISARAWPPKTMYHKEAQLVVESSFGHNKLIMLILASGHNEPSGLINGLVGHSEPTKLNGLIFHHELIKLINVIVGYIKLTELISLVLEGHINDFQQGAASHFNDNCFHRLIVVSVSEGAQQVAPTQQTISSTILKLIDKLISEGA
jgi:hypothetical protein